MSREYQIRSSEIKQLYAIGARAGLLESGNKDDELHLLVRRETGKDSIKKLTRGEFFRVYGIIKNELDGEITETKRDNSLVQKAWQLMYELEKISPKKSYNATVGERLCGIIRKVVKVDAHVKDPFRFVKYDKDIIRVIEEIKKYIRSEKRKAKKDEENKANSRRTETKGVQNKAK